MLLAGGLVVVGLAFRELISLALAVLITVILALPMSALATWLERYGVPRALGALGGLLVGVAAVGLIGRLILPPLISETERFVDAVPGIVDEVRDWVRDVTGAESGEVGERVQAFLENVAGDPASILGPVLSIGAGLAGAVAALVLVLLTAFYMAARPEPLVEGTLRLFPPARREVARATMLELREAWLGWLVGVLVDMLVTGVLLYLGLLIVGLDFRLVFAVFAALLVVVPYFGAIIGGIPPVLFALTESPGTAVAVLAIYVIVQQIEGNVVIPLVMSRAVKLHPAVIAIGVVVSGQLFGLLGLLVSVPLMSSATILVRRLWVDRIEGPAEPRPPPAAAATHRPPVRG